MIDMEFTHAGYSIFCGFLQGVNFLYMQLNGSLQEVNFSFFGKMEIFTSCMEPSSFGYTRSEASSKGHPICISS